jgi:hypothetical protein
MNSENKHIKDKIRQQLQFLRDKTIISIVGEPTKNRRRNYKINIKRIY